MRKFSIRILKDLNIWYSHYFSDKFIKEKMCYGYFKEIYPLAYSSRKFDKPSQKTRNGSYFWCLDDKWHRVGKPAWIGANGGVNYYENGERIK